MGPLPTYYQTDFKFNINETSEVEGTADHVMLLRLLMTVFSIQLSCDEEKLLHAAEYGDIPTVKRILEQNSDLKVRQTSNLITIIDLHLMKF